MKFLFSILIAFFSMNIFANDCSQFPTQSGPFQKEVDVKGLPVTIKADFIISKGHEFGRDYISHTFQSPEFYVEGRRVSVDHRSAIQIFQRLGYHSLSYVVNKKTGILDKGLLLDSDLRVRRITYGEIILQDKFPIGAYHPVCSNWQY